MPSIDFLCAQIKAVRAQAAERARSGHNLHYQACDTLNGLRKHLIRILPPELGDYVSDTVLELRSSKGDPPYPEKAEVAVLTCDRLLQVCAEAREQAQEVPRIVGSASRSVFIVHGHDEANLLRLERLLEKRWSLKPIVLKNSPSQSKTVIEKFEAAATDCGYAFVLLTPDDQVMTKAGGVYQARPNVVFELGWFCGRLGRERVCLLYKQGTNIHSDLAGVVRVEFRDTVEEKLGEIEAELMAANLI